MQNFNKNVFVNCPFDEDYKQILSSIIFTIVELGYIPRLSIERADSGESRIAKIVSLINESKFGIHDLSRIISSEENEHFRMNMPFELGIDYGAKVLKDGQWSEKKLLILEKERYRFQKSLSDLSGSDIKNHDNEPLKAVKAIRDWFVVTEDITAPSSNKIWTRFNEFNAHIYTLEVEQGGHNSLDDLQLTEIIRHINKWINSSSAASNQEQDNDAAA